MINLLPPQQKEKLLYQGYLRLILILGILFLSFLFSLFLVLLLVRVYVGADLETQRIILEEKKRIIFLNQEIEKEIIQFNVFLSDLNSFYQENLDLTQVLEKLYETLPSKTYLTDFSFGFISREGKKKPRISLSGYCPDRDTLLEFKQELEKWFYAVSFSPESWIKPTGINFSLTLEID